MVNLGLIKWTTKELTKILEKLHNVELFAYLQPTKVEHVLISLG